MKYLLFAFLVVGFTQVGRAQNDCACDAMQAYIQERDFDSTIQYQAKNLWSLSKEFEKENKPRCHAFAFQLKAQVQFKNHQFLDARRSLEKEKHLLDSIRCKSVSYTENYLAFGDLFLVEGNVDEAISNYSKAIKVSQKQKNNVFLSKAYLGLALAYNRKKEKEKAVYYSNLAFGLVSKLADNKTKIDLLNQLSSRYFKSYKITKNPALLDSALNVVSFSRVLTTKIDCRESLLEIYNLYEEHAYLTQNYRLALQYLDSALSQTSSVVNWRERGAIFADMADIYLEIKRYGKAYQFADSNLVYVKKGGNPFEITNALELLYNCAKLSGEYERALDVFQDLAIMRDSVSILQNQEAYNQLEEKYHRVRKEKTEAEYEQDRRLLQQQQEIGNLKWRLILVGSVIFALLGAYVLMVFRQKNMKQKQKHLEIQYRLNKARINPDFIYEALNKLQVEGGQPSSDYKKQVQSFSKLLKQVLDSNYDDFMTLDREIEFLTFYLNLQRERMKQGFDFQFEVDEQLDLSNVCIPTMILQPFVESTVTDGFKNLGKQGLITIKFCLKGLNELEIIISDNGKGLKAIDSTRASEIINDRLYLLNKLNKTSASYLIRERSSGGVSVEIFIPLITKAYADELKKEGF